MTIYDLLPLNGQKSFYGKAKVILQNNGDKILVSYNTEILKITSDGQKIRLWDGWSTTPGKHIAAFCGLNKKAFLALPLEA